MTAPATWLLLPSEHWALPSGGGALPSEHWALPSGGGAVPSGGGAVPSGGGAVAGVRPDVGPAASDRVIAVDGGVATAAVLGWSVDAIVGDLDSAPRHLHPATRGPDGMAVGAAPPCGVELVVAPTDKDETDLELALAWIEDAQKPPVRNGVGEENENPGGDANRNTVGGARANSGGRPSLWIVGGDGGRLDHLFTNLAVLTRPRGGGRHWRWLAGDSTVEIVEGPLSIGLDLERGRLFSVAAQHGDAEGVRLMGARWPLDGPLLAGVGLGTSNVALGGSVNLEVDTGVVTVVLPEGATVEA